jgi:hypothetical protein
MAWYKKEHKITTGFTDANGEEIWVGDILECIYGYRVLVCQHPDSKEFYGSLICPIGDSCRDIPYSLNQGNGHVLA